jgi:hypothetical protein
VSFVSCLDACLDAVGVRLPLGRQQEIQTRMLFGSLSTYQDACKGKTKTKGNFIAIFYNHTE